MNGIRTASRVEPSPRADWSTPTPTGVTRLEAPDRLATVAHDLRNPLAVIEFNAARLIQESTIDRPTMELGLETILRSVRRAERLVQDLLGATTEEPLSFDVKPTVVSPMELLRDAATTGQALAAQASVQFTMPEISELLAVKADRERIAQVFGNLIENAIKHTPPGGWIVLRAASVGSEIHFSVADNGPGITEEDRPRLFERCWQADPNDQRGRGLGLWICKQIVESHGGRIWFECPGPGTTVIFALQCSIPENEHGIGISG